MKTEKKYHLNANTSKKLLANDLKTGTINSMKNTTRIRRVTLQEREQELLSYKGRHEIVNLNH